MQMFTSHVTCHGGYSNKVGVFIAVFAMYLLSIYYLVVMSDTKNIDLITTTFRTKYRSIDYSNDYLLHMKALGTRLLIA